MSGMKIMEWCVLHNKIFIISTKKKRKKKKKKEKKRKEKKKDNGMVRYNYIYFFSPASFFS
jgi:hypothetical protein